MAHQYNAPSVTNTDLSAESKSTTLAYTCIHVCYGVYRAATFTTPLPCNLYLRMQILESHSLTSPVGPPVCCLPFSQAFKNSKTWRFGAQAGGCFNFEFKIAFELEERLIRTGNVYKIMGKIHMRVIQCIATTTAPDSTTAS